MDFPSPVCFHVLEIICTFRMKNGMIFKIDDEGNEVQVVVHVSYEKMQFHIKTINCHMIKGSSKSNSHRNMFIDQHYLSFMKMVFLSYCENTIDKWFHIKTNFIQTYFIWNLKARFHTNNIRFHMKLSSNQNDLQHKNKRQIPYQ